MKFLMVFVAAGMLMAASTERRAPSFTVPYGNVSTGKRFSLSEHSGKVLIMSFFTWDCKNCVKEIPFVIGLLNTYQEKGLRAAFLHVGVEGLGDFGDDYQFGSKFSAKKIDAMFEGRREKVDWKTLTVVLDWNMLERSPIVYAKYIPEFRTKRTIATPHVVVIDASSSIVYDHAGWFENEAAGKKELEAAVTNALASLAITR
ncbi:MAG: hypothetical protein AABZ39_12005 [Spirochaetota bacterium]